MITIPTTPSFGLNGKRALVIGASSGIGIGCAAALAQAGAHLVIAARREQELNELAQAFSDKGWPTTARVLDIGSTDAIAELIEAEEPFDILVNSAGIGRHGPALDTIAEDFDVVVQTNLRGAYFLSQAVAKKLIAAKRPGSIIHISSQMGHVGGIERAVYCASKHGVEGFTKAMAVEWGPHSIRINTICPTFIRTKLTESTFAQPDKLAWIKSKIHLGRIGEVEDIMGSVVFLASDASSLITGTSILVDGGWTAE